MQGLTERIEKAQESQAVIDLRQLNERIAATDAILCGLRRERDLLVHQVECQRRFARQFDKRLLGEDGEYYSDGGNWPDGITADVPE